MFPTGQTGLNSVCVSGKKLCPLRLLRFEYMCSSECGAKENLVFLSLGHVLKSSSLLFRSESA